MTAPATTFSGGPASQSLFAVHELIFSREGQPSAAVASYPWRQGLLGSDALRSVSSSGESINHLPDPNDLLSIDQELTVEISNQPRTGGVSTYQWLLALMGGTLEGASVQYIEHAFDLPPPKRLTDEVPISTPRFTGVVGQVLVGSLTSFTLRVVVDIPSQAWGLARGAQTDPRDLGRRFPAPVGATPRVQGINYQVGWITTLTNEISDTFTGQMTVESTGHMADGNAQIGLEEVAYTVVDEKTINITARDVVPANRLPHFAGDQVTEILANTVFVFSALPTLSLDHIEVLNNFGQLVDVDFGTKNVADTTTVPGRTVASLSFTAAEMKTLAELLAFRSGQNDGQIFNPVTGQEQDFTVESIHNNENITDDLDALAGGIYRWAGEDQGNEDSFRFTVTGSPANGTSRISRYRFLFSFTWSNDWSAAADMTTRIRFMGSGADITAIGEINEDTNDFLNQSKPKTFSRGYQTNNGTATLNDLVTAGSQIEWTNKIKSGQNGIPDVSTWTKTRAWIEVDLDAAPPTPETQNTINSGFGLELYADVQGFVDIGQFRQAYAFDDPLGWSFSNGEHVALTEGQIEGTGAQALAIAAIVVDTENDAVNWTSALASDISDVFSDALEVNVVQGTDTSGDAQEGIWLERAITLDMTTIPGVFILDLLPVSTYGRTDLLVLEIYLSSSPAGSGFPGANSARWDFDLLDWSLNEWSQFITDGTDATVDNGVDLAAITSLQIRWGKSGAGGPAFGFAQQQVSVHDPSFYAVSASPRVLQKNDLGGIDMAAGPSDKVRMQFFQTLGQPVTVELQLSNTVGVGTTAPAGARIYDFTVPSASGWHDVEGGLTSGAAQDTSAVETIRMSFIADATPANGLNPLTGGFNSPIPIFGIAYDDLQQFLPSDTEYLAGTGNTLTHPLDIARALVEKSGGVVNADAYLTAATRTSTALRLSGDLRAVGETWREIFASVLYHGCLSAFPNGDGEWVFQTPTFPNYNWQGAVEIVQNWDKDGRTINFRSLEDEVYSGFNALYDQDPSLGIGDESYRSAMTASSLGSTIPGVTAADCYALEEQVGFKLAPTFLFPLISDQSTAEQVIGYYIHEYLRMPPVVRVFGVPHHDAWTVRVGDVAQVPRPDTQVAFQGRVLESLKDSQTQQTEITLLDTLATQLPPVDPPVPPIITEPPPTGGVGLNLNWVRFPPNSYLFRAGLLGSNMIDGTWSVWVNEIDTGGAVFYDVFQALDATGGGVVTMRLGTSDSSQVLHMNYTSPPGGTAVFVDDADIPAGVLGTRYHVLFAFDTTAGVAHLYVNDVAQSLPSLITAPGSGYTFVPHFHIRATGLGTDPAVLQPNTNEFSDLWVANTFIDISIEAERRKFITADLQGVDLGPTGLNPGVGAPKVFFGGAQFAVDWDNGINNGNGGNFTRVGDPLVDA